jgi:hypothetical protein
MDLNIYRQHAFLDLIERRRERRIIRAALGRAYTAFNRSYPRWTAALFDEYLLVQTVEVWLARPRDAQALTPHALAGAWAMQLSPQPSRREALRAECLPVAAEFLRLLGEELSSAPVLSSALTHRHAETPANSFISTR